MSRTPAPVVIRLANGGTSIDVMDYGATWLSCRVTLKDGSQREIVLAAATPEEHLTQDGYLGQTVGRYSNRIANARFVLDGKTIELVPNEGVKQLHGGPDGFWSRRWEIVSQSASEVVFGLHSPDGDQGFPGAADVRSIYRVEADGSVTLEHTATVDKPSPVNMTNHVYFNLDGKPTDNAGHRLKLRATQYLPTDKDAIPLDGLAPVAGTSFDFRVAKTIGQDRLTDLQQEQAKGYDHAFFMDADAASGKEAAAELEAADGKLKLAMYTNLPSVQLYTGQYLAGIPGREGPYKPFQGLCLEPQFLPDSVNHPEWDQESCILQPGQTYHRTIRYVFTAQ